MIGSLAAFAETAFPMAHHYGNKRHDRWAKRLLCGTSTQCTSPIFSLGFRLRGHWDSRLVILAVLLLNSDANMRIMLRKCARLWEVAQLEIWSPLKTTWCQQLHHGSCLSVKCGACVNLWTHCDVIKRSVIDVFDSELVRLWNWTIDTPEVMARTTSPRRVQACTPDSRTDCANKSQDFGRPAMFSMYFIST